MRLKKGDLVEWSSQSQGSWTKKIGEVVATVPVHSNPNKCLPLGYRCNASAGYGFGRNHESYLVKVVGKSNALYWPYVSKLNPIEKSPDITINIFRAQSIVDGDNIIPTLRINISEQIKSCETLGEQSRLLAKQAEELALALFRSLPGGTIDALLRELMKRKVSLLSVPLY